MKLLLSNARILTMDAELTEFDNGWIELTGTQISALGNGSPSPEKMEGYAASEIIDVEGDLLMPGMINSHCHMSMTLFRGLGEDVDDRLFRYVLPLERRCITPDAVAVGTRLAALESLRAGVTTIADMYYFETEVGKVIDDSGLRGVVGQTIATFPTPDQTSVDEGFALTDILVDQFKDHPRVRPSIAPHAPYSTDIAVMERIADWSSMHPCVPVQLHLAEMQSEMQWAADVHQCRPVETVDRAGLLKSGLIAAHCLYVNEKEMDRLAECDVRVAHNARSNAKAGRGIAPVEAMRRRGIPVGIATDGPMSGNTLDLFAQFGLVSMLQKLAGNSRAPMPARDVVSMATLEAARVLGMDAEIGSLEPGKQADIVRVSLQDPRMQPLWDPYAALVFSATPADVQDVMVAGTWLLRNRQSLTLEHEKIIHDAQQVARQFNSQIQQIDAQ